MRTLRNLATATGVASVPLPSGTTARIPAWKVRFNSASPDRLPEGVLSKTYTSKPLVIVGDEALFGELEVVRLLERDGWSAVWADTFHGKFWGSMPHQAAPVRLPKYPNEVYERVARGKGGPGGCFDVVAWKGEDVLFVEYKGPGDRPNKNEPQWIEAALGAGVRESDLLFVGEKVRPRTL